MASGKTTITTTTLANGTTVITGATTVQEALIPSALDGTTPFSKTPMFYSGVPGDVDPNKLNLEPDPLAKAYGNAGMNRTAILKGIKNDDAKAKKAEEAKKLKLKEESDQKWIQDNIDEGAKDGQLTIDQYKKLTQVPDIGYVTAAQARLFIGGILVDECYDLQYQYKEYKEPVYGYNDKHWGAVLKGNVIVSGTFTINYKHDAYLIKLLERLVEDKSKGDEVNKAWNRKAALDKSVLQYKEAIAGYKALQDNVNAAKTETKELAATLKAKKEILARVNKAPSNIEADYKAKNAALAKNKTEFMASLDPEDREKVLNDETNFVKATEQYQNTTANNSQFLKQETDKLAVINKRLGELRANVTNYEKQISSLEAKGKETGFIYNTASIREQLTSSLNEIAKLNADATKQSKSIDEVQKANKEFLAPAAAQVEDSLDDNSKQYVKMQLQAKKLEAEQKAATDRLATEKAAIEAEISKIEESKKSRDDYIRESEQALNKFKDGLTDMKNDLNDLNDATMRAAANKDYAITPDGYRAEDYGTWRGSKFAIFIEYNGTIHKILEDCTLTGHGHVVAQGGEVIKEYYTFICRKIR